MERERYPEREYAPREREARSREMWILSQSLKTMISVRQRVTRSLLREGWTVADRKAGSRCSSGGGGWSTVTCPAPHPLAPGPVGLLSFSFPLVIMLQPILIECNEIPMIGFESFKISCGPSLGWHRLQPSEVRACVWNSPQSQSC